MLTYLSRNLTEIDSNLLQNLTFLLASFSFLFSTLAFGLFFVNYFLLKTRLKSKEQTLSSYESRLKSLQFTAGQFEDILIGIRLAMRNSASDKRE